MFSVFAVFSVGYGTEAGVDVVASVGGCRERML